MKMITKEALFSRHFLIDLAELLIPSNQFLPWGQKLKINLWLFQLKKPVANTTTAPKAPENKKKNPTNAAQHDSSRSSVRSRIESPDSSVSSNPSSPVSSTKSSPLGLSGSREKSGLYGDIFWHLQWCSRYKMLISNLSYNQVF